MPNEQTATPNNWTIIEPGLIELNTTKIRIRYRTGASPFVIERDGNVHAAAGTLAAAKAYAMDLLNDLLCMGFEP